MKTTRKSHMARCPKTDGVKLTVNCTVMLKADLDLYAALRGRTCGVTVDASMLIPHMLKAFMARDRAFPGASRSTA